jgi:hypothetical protein
LQRCLQRVGRMGSSLLFATKTKLYPCYRSQNCIFGAVLKKIFASQACNKDVVVQVHHPETSPAVSDCSHSVLSAAGTCNLHLRFPYRALFCCCCYSLFFLMSHGDYGRRHCCWVIVNLVVFLVAIAVVVVASPSTGMTDRTLVTSQIY